jgi:hypothetical protein
MIITKKDSPTMKRVLHLFQSSIFPDAVIDDNDAEVFDFNDPDFDMQDQLGELMRELDDMDLTLANSIEAPASSAAEEVQEESPHAATVENAPAQPVPVQAVELVPADAVRGRGRGRRRGKQGTGSVTHSNNDGRVTRTRATRTAAAPPVPATPDIDDELDEEMIA